MKNKKIIIVSGSGGLIGSEAVEFFVKKNFYVIGLDNNYRKLFFGINGSVNKRVNYLKKKYERNYLHVNCNINNKNIINNIFKKFNKKICAVIHSAAQPSHDWAKQNPLLDFNVNAVGTLNLLEHFRIYSPKASFIYLSTNKVYGDNPNFLKIREYKTRYDLDKKDKYYSGIDEKFNIDDTKHSLFGASKLSADITVQEYGKYFNLNTVCLRAGCLTGENHSGVELHGFLSYLIKCIKTDKEYKIFGYKGKQVRDNIHSSDLISAIWEFIKNPKKGETYNLGGGRKNSCSIIEVINFFKLKDKKIKYKFYKENRSGDHIWYISNFEKFKKDYPNWKIKNNLEMIFDKIYFYSKFSKLN
jgi:CDP-paratose 2-epimerase